MRAFLSVGGPAQAEYEKLREIALSGGRSITPQALRFERYGLTGLVRAVREDPVLAGHVVGAVRPRWTPHADPRCESLADAYGVLLSHGDEVVRTMEG
jgi:hypothetical protein